MGTKTSATHVHSEIHHRVGGDIGSVVRDFFGSVYCWSGFQEDEEMMNSVENDTVSLEMIIFNLTVELLTLNNWVSNQENVILMNFLVFFFYSTGNMEYNKIEIWKFRKHYF
jgi:hypothetical protein